MATLKQIHQHIDENFDEHLERTKAFVRQPSISADGTGMAETAAMVADLIREAGGEAEIVPTPGYPVVYGEINVGAPKTLLAYGMYDVQPVLGETWDVSDPFGGEVLDLPGLGPSLVNRGIFNSKGPLVGLLNALQSFRAVGEQYPVNLKFMVEGEEELGSRNLPGFVEANKDRLKADFAFFGFYAQDIKDKVIMYLGVKGILFMELIVRGDDWGGPTSRGIHGSNAVWFHSPTWVLLHALSGMFTPDQKHILLDGFYDDIVSPSAEDEELLARLVDTFTPETQLEENDVRRFKYDLAGVDLMRKYLYQPTLNIDGIISGHTAEGTKTLLPHEARAKIDIRMVPNMRPERMVQLVKDHLARHGYADKIDVIVHDSYPPAKTCLRGNPAAEALLATYRDLGFEPEIWPHLAGSAPFYLFTEVLDIPVALGGLGHGGRAHSPNEYVTLDGIKLYEKSVATFLMNLGADREDS
ncbi:MAG: M20/M25/M40 family metallo-hydrolase [Chloroflexi bacterium]|nr:M20/M25/M40 family metallo-hydrolase [Chloroflexota bacterium]